VSGHPTPEDLKGFLQQPPGPATAERNALIVRHLLAKCPVCLQNLQDLKGMKSVLSRILEVPLTETETKEAQENATRYNYDWAFARADRALKTQLAHGRPSERLPRILAELSALPESEQIRIVRKGGRFADPNLVQYLLDRSHAVRYENPRKMLHLAQLAQLAAEACSSEAAEGENQLSDLRAQAWGQFANALRVSGRLSEAESAFVEARRLCEAGTGDPMIHAHLLSKTASLYLFQRRMRSAIESVDEAGQIYRGLGKMHLLAGTLVKKGIFHLYGGETEKASRVVREALPLIDREENPRLFLAAHHNLALCYIDMDQPEEALGVFYQARDLYRNASDSLIVLRAFWQEGRLLREIGHLHNAEVALLRARQGFIEAGLGYEAVLISLDLAEVYTKTGETDKLRRTVAEALPILQALRVERDTLAALLWLQQIAGQQEETD
jgi:tetratricopeptide (TPR) repeat protein